MTNYTKLTIAKWTAVVLSTIAGGLAFGALGWMGQFAVLVGIALANKIAVSIAVRRWP